MAHYVLFSGLGYVASVLWLIGSVLLVKNGKRIGYVFLVTQGLGLLRHVTSDISAVLLAQEAHRSPRADMSGLIGLVGQVEIIWVYVQVVLWQITTVAVLILMLQVVRAPSRVALPPTEVKSGSNPAESS